MTNEGHDKKGKEIDPVLREKLKEIIEKENISQKEIAKKLDYSQSSVSGYLNGKYEGNLEEFEETLKSFFLMFQSKKAAKKAQLEFVKTSAAVRFFNTASVCHLNSEIGLCTGASGVGKTTAIKKYAKDHTGVIVVDPDENISIRTLLKLIARALRLKIPSNNCPSQEFTEKITERLNGSDYLIVIDEAENLDSSCFRTLRKIHDRCNYTLGLLFVGTERLAANLARMQGEFSYVTNRLGFIETLNGLTFEDAQKLINQIFPDCKNEIAETFFKLSRGNARILFNLLKRSFDIQSSSDEEINSKMVQRAFKRVTL